MAKFGGNWPDENGMAKTWNVPKYNVDFSRAAAPAIGELSAGIDDDTISVGNARLSSPEFMPSSNWKPFNSSASTTEYNFQLKHNEVQSLRQDKLKITENISKNNEH